MLKFFRQIMTRQSVINTLSSELRPGDLGSTKELTYYIVFGPGTTAGAVQIETAHEQGYAGTWAPEGTPVAWVAANRVHKLSITGSSYVGRARISTAIVGGTVDVFAIANN